MTHVTELPEMLELESLRNTGRTGTQEAPQGSAAVKPHTGTQESPQQWATDLHTMSKSSNISFKVTDKGGGHPRYQG